ncbi:MAG: hypothetical protein FWF46_09320 [Oscillospiraceae bacterium]|nr:hypothetical protein [Oscillospiraceae bacterium]
MDEDVRFKLSQITMEKMELRSSLNEINYLLKVKPNIKLSKEIDRILDRLKYLEILELEIRKRL